MRLLEVEQLGNDLFARTACKCGEVIRLVGYNDGYFFNDVNASPKEGACAKCSRRYWFKWRPAGVEFVLLAEQEAK